jgi:peptidoglycan/LPS O-acetylase OafA/YrhL
MVDASANPDVGASDADSPAPPLGYQPGLDGLRGIAILAVLGLHVVDAWFPGGALGVDVFFVLSGFLISTIVLEELRASRSDDFGFARFYVRRFLRLFPALYTMLAAVAVYALVSPASTRGVLLPEIGVAALYMGNLSWAWGRSLTWLGHTWSLALEEQFYLVWPAILVSCVRRTWIRALTGALAATVVAVLAYRVAVGIDPRGLLLQRPDALVVGCLLALVRWQRPRRFEALGSPVLVGAVSLGILLLLLAGDGHWFPEDLYFRGLYLGVSGATAVLLAHLVSRPVSPGGTGSPVVRALSTRPLTQVGRISYGLYVWHYPVFIFISLHTGLTGPAAFVAKVAGAFGFALASWFLVERRALRLKSRFASKRAPSHVPPALEPG